MQLHPDGHAATRSRKDKVRFVGDTVAVVVAETKAQAVDAAEAVIVDYDPLAAVVDMEAALAPDAPLQFDDDRLERRACGDRDATAATRSRAPTWSCAGGSRTSGSRSCRWRARRSRSIPGDDGDGHELTVYLGVPDAAHEPRRPRRQLRARARHACG